MEKKILISFKVFLALITLNLELKAQWNTNTSSIFLSDSSKNVGIGTSKPYGKLHISGFINIVGNATTGSAKIRLQAANSTNDNVITSKDENSNDLWLMNLANRSHNNAFSLTSGQSGGTFSISKNGNVGIGTFSPYGKLEVYGGFINVAGATSHAKLRMQASSSTNENRIESRDQSSNYLWYISMGVRNSNNKFALYSGTTGSYIFNISTSGNVGIKTNYSSTYALNVCGSIRATEVRVQTNWCDYVFNKDYDLKPLEEVEQFIAVNNHLPDVTPGNKIESEGLDVGQTSSQMIRKIEELTLYVIQLNNKMKQKDSQIKELSEAIKTLESEANSK